MRSPIHASTTRLVFALHFHQPHGNLDEVFTLAMERCYLPTLALLGDHPEVRAAVHVSGPLLEWAESHRPEMIDALAKLTARGQVEILGGGWQEPMLAILPERDAIAQLSYMAERCRELFGARPRGMWLTERVWEPDLARVVARGGYRYTLLDDSHLRAAGAAAPLGAYYVTDKAGESIAVFPIDRGLRTRIPFAELDELIEYLDGQRGRAPTYGDDAEKFGLWPTTDRRVWREKWLERFFEALADNAAWLESVTPGQVLDDTPAAGAIYIPTISYAEMGAWTLPPDASLGYQHLADRLRLAGMGEEAESFLRGGIWQAFVAKYPESNIIYRKMLRVSELVEGARGSDAYPAARAALFRGQCNCAYWHGLFGGLYLGHLRNALMQALIEAEALATRRDGVELTRADHDGDWQEELLFEGPALDLYVSPARGGSAFELDLIAARHHLTGVLGRRREAYHEDVARAQVVSDEELGNISAHDLVRATEPGLSDKLVVDAYPRGAFVDHLLPRATELDDLDRRYRPLVDLPRRPYRVIEAGAGREGARALLRCQADGLTLDKAISMGPGARIDVRYRLSADAIPPGSELARPCFAVELDVTLLSPDEVGGRRIQVLEGDGALRAPGARGVERDVSALSIAAESMGIDVVVRADPPAELWRLPIETVSQSERGFERAYQGTALVFVWRPDLASQPFEASLSLELPS
jgi:alpha-amylase